MAACKRPGMEGTAPEADRRVWRLNHACKAAAPDGYTLCLLTRSTVSINPEIYRKLSYEPLKDFEPVTNGFFGQQIVILNKNVPVKTLAELVDYSKKNPPTNSTSPP